MPVRKRNDGWQIDFTVDNIRYRKVVHSNKKTAERRMADWRREIELGIPQLRVVTFKAFIGEYFDWEKVHRAPSTHQGHLSYARKHLLPEFGSRLMGSITPGMVDRWKISIAKILKPGTVNVQLQFLSAVFNRAVEDSVVRENVVKKVERLKVPKPPPEFFSEEEIVALVEAAPSQQYRTLLILAANTGMRMQELLNLEWGDIARGSVTVRPKEHWNTKTGKSRIIPLNNTSRDALSKHPRHFGCQWVFWHEKGKPYTPYGVHQGWWKLRERAGVRKLRFHCLRHSFASHLMMSGNVDIKTIQELLGHSSVTMTEIYSHLSPQHIAKSVGEIELGVTIRSPAIVDANV